MVRDEAQNRVVGDMVGLPTELHVFQAWVVIEHAVRKCLEPVAACAYGVEFRPCDVRHELFMDISPRDRVPR